MEKAAVFYTSMSGNTEEAATIIAESINAELIDVELLEDFGQDRFAAYDLLFFGTYTWADGVLPDPMRKFLRRLLKQPTLPSARCFVFGTGDRVFPRFCRAVDEVKYHLEQHGLSVCDNLLKLEQSPRSSSWVVVDWVYHNIHRKDVAHANTENQGSRTEKPE